MSYLKFSNKLVKDPYGKWIKQFSLNRTGETVCEKAPVIRPCEGLFYEEFASYDANAFFGRSLQSFTDLQKDLLELCPLPVGDPQNGEISVALRNSFGKETKFYSVTPEQHMKIEKIIFGEDCQ